MRFEHVLVVGAGQMGGGIAQVVAASGRRVSLHDPFPGATERGLETMRASLAKLAEKGGSDPDEVLARVEPVEDPVAADLMIEAVIEDAATKEEVFRRADATLPPEAILASNTSSIPITSLAAVTSRPDKVIGMHFFNPVPVLRLVEVIRAVQTSDETAATARNSAGAGTRSHPLSRLERMAAAKPTATISTTRPNSVACTVPLYLIGALKN